VLAVAVGVSTIIALSAQAEGVSSSIIRDLSKLGPDVIILSGRSGYLFTDVDVARLKDFEGVASVNQLIMASVRVSGVEDAVTVIGVYSTSLTNLVGELNLVEGTPYYDVPAPQALIGNSLAFDANGDTRYKSGQPLQVTIAQRSIILDVVGVLDSYGSSPIIQPDRSIFLPLHYMSLIIRMNGYNYLLLKSQSIDGVETVSQLVTNAYGSKVAVTSVKQISQTVSSIASQISLLLMGVAGTSFIAAGLGTFNIMMISVLERVREIGILKSLGMRNERVLTLYISQGILIGVLGCITGLLMGVGLAYLLPEILSGFRIEGVNTPRIGFGQSINIMSSYTPMITTQNIMLATFTSIIVTLISSAYPAWKASHLKPVEALRYE
jgi:putative ABC transport system permease protein